MLGLFNFVPTSVFSELNHQKLDFWQGSRIRSRVQSTRPRVFGGREFEVDLGEVGLAGAAEPRTREAEPRQRLVRVVSEATGSDLKWISQNGFDFLFTTPQSDHLFVPGPLGTVKGCWRAKQPTQKLVRFPGVQRPKFFLNTRRPVLSSPFGPFWSPAPSPFGAGEP